MKAGIAAMEREREATSPPRPLRISQDAGLPVVLAAAVMLVLVGVTHGLAPAAIASGWDFC